MVTIACSDGVGVGISLLAVYGIRRLRRQFQQCDFLFSQPSHPVSGVRCADNKTKYEKTSSCITALEFVKRTARPSSHRRTYEPQ